MNVESRYKKLSQREHILLRSGMYIGETKKTIEEKWVFDIEKEKIQKKVVEYSPAFLKLFDEILTNATDHSFRDKTLTQIKININIETGEISVYNNGEGIPVVIHKEHKIYVPELIFGHLLSGENYNDNTKRIGGGMNGLGATLVNIYSTKFKVETVDANNKLKFEQVFKNNMLEKSEPKITKTNVKSFTRITYITDFKRFGMNMIDTDTLSLLLKRVYDAIVCTDKKIVIYYNDKKINGKGLIDYIKYYDKESKIYEQQVLSDNFIWEYIIVPNDTYEQMSFVNGICTTNGGKHVDCIMTQIITNMKKMLESKKKLNDVKQNMIKERIFIFLRATVINPTFNSQTKEVLTTPIKDFGYKIEISEKFITKVWKSEIIEMIEKSYKLKEQVDLEKTSSSNTRKNKLYIPKLEDAHFAGTSKSKLCTLILTEGDSAKTFAMWGRTIIGSDYYGVFSLKGKILNIRDATTSQLLNNEEFNNIKKIIGLQHNKQYTNVNELRYGKVMLLMDADHDGSHIVGLFINALHYYWPELLKLNFIQKLKTPIVKIPQKNLEFFTEQDYNKWKLQNTIKNIKIKYYKGLGTSQKDDAKNIFKRLDELLVNFNYNDEKCNQAILLAFSKDKETSANKRKEWLKEYDKNTYLDLNEKNICYSDFINKELIHFSNYDNIRSIPQLMDGLKPSQRKILFYMLKNNITKSIKVAQLSGYVSAETSYHHGEASLQQAIISMAQDFIGTNNINLLYPDGNHGCLDPYTKIVVENGVKYAKDIKINDKVLGDDGNLRTVLQITKGKDTMYKIYYTKTEYYIVNSQHILTLKYKTKSSKKFTTIFDKELLKQVKVKNIQKNSNIIDIKVEDYLKLPQYIKMKFKNVYYNRILEWNTNLKIKIPPYIYANWLMCRLTKSKIELKCLDSYIKWKVYCDDKNIQMTKGYVNKNIFRLSGKWSDVLNDMKYLTNHYNNIPPEYIYTDYEMRLEFIYGLIDGRCKMKNSWCKIDLKQCKELYSSIIKLLKTLPLRYKVNVCKTKFKNYNYSIWINLNQIKKNKSNILYKVQEIGYGSYVGFEIDGNKRFVIETSNMKYIITHNSRLLGGKDAASPRYIYTYLNEITSKIFDKKDVKLLKNIEDDGIIVEPEYYIPIIPLVLVNGCEGIGTGYSTFIPPCNPKEIVLNIKRKINNEKLIDLQPYYKNFKGTIVKLDNNKYQIKGKWTRKMNTIIITELPIGIWLTTYKEMIEKKIKDENASQITDIKNMSIDENTNIKIIITFKSSEILDKLEKNNELESLLKLVKTLSTNNMYLFLKSSLKKYNTLNDIFLDYYELRLEYYRYRKLLIQKELQDELNILQQKLKFITEFINGDIIIIHKEIDEIHTQLHNRKYILFQDSYDYLTNMQIKSLTKTKITELTKIVELKTKELEKLQKSTEYELWLNDLDAIEKLI
jgi:DNA gyrase/topoisomerase IV subunit B